MYQRRDLNPHEKWLIKISNSKVGNNLVFNEESVQGSLVEALNTQIMGYDEQLIVMGSLGKTGTLGKLIGSNALKVVDNVNCPVFVIPPNAAFTFSSEIVFAVDSNQVPKKNQSRFIEGDLLTSSI